MRIWGLHFGLPYDGIHPTEHFSILQSEQYLSSASLKPNDFQHPALFQYLITFTARLSSLPLQNYLYFYLLGRIISCLASILAVWFIYRLAKNLFNSKASGLLCASFLGFNLLSVKYAHYAVPDSLCLLFLILSITFALRILENPVLKNYIFCAVFCGLSIASKFSGLISLGFLFCAHILAKKEKFSHYKFVFSLVAVFLVFFAVSPYHLIFLKDAAADFSRYLGEKGYFNAWGFRTSGFFTYPFILLPDAFGFLAFLFALAGLGTMLLKERIKALLLVLPLLLYFLIIGKEKGGTLQNLLLFLPMFCIGVTYFLSFIKEKGAPPTIVVILIALSLLPQLARTLIFDCFLLRADTRVLAQNWLLENVKEKAKIAFERYTPFDLNYADKSMSAKIFDSVYFVPSAGVYPASFFKDEGYDYIVTSNFRRDSYIFFCRTEALCEEADNYSTYDKQMELAAAFKPPGIFKFAGVTLPWGTWPHNPVVKIYKVKK